MVDEFVVSLGDPVDVRIPGGDVLRGVITGGLDNNGTYCIKFDVDGSELRFPATAVMLVVPDDPDPFRQMARAILPPSGKDWRDLPVTPTHFDAIVDALRLLDRHGIPIERLSDD